MKALRYDGPPEAGCRLNDKTELEPEWQIEVCEMENKQDEWVCAHCGYTASGRFLGDICPQCGLTYWKCANCGLTITAEAPPGVCPGCGEKCNFINVTCYIPECGGPGRIDPRL